MLSRRDILAAVATLALTAPPVSAAEKAPFTQAAFAEAQAAGAPILVEITAPWCPTCRAQQPVLDRLESEPKFKALKVFKVDFDSQKNVVRQFGANSQSTLIMFKGKQETGRSVGDTGAGSIEALLSSAL